MKSMLAAFAMLLSMAALAGDEPQQDELIAVVPDNFPPYYLLDRSGQPTGLAIETIERLASIGGFRLRYLIKPDWDSTMGALRQGEADLIPNLGITPERARDFNFTAPLETFGLGLFVRSVNTDIHDMDDLVGKSVAVVNRNAAVKWLENYPQVDRRLYEHQEQALFALLAGEVDAFIYPITVTWKMASDIGVDERIRQAGLPLMEIKRAIAVRKGNQELLTRLDKAVHQYISSEQYGEAYSRWHATPELFWTLERVLRYGSGIVAFLLAVTVFFLLWWRHQSIVKITLQLQECQSMLESHREEIQGLKEQLAQEKGGMSGGSVDENSDSS